MTHSMNIHRGDAEAWRFDEISEAVIGACIGIHRGPGRGLLESAFGNKLKRIVNSFAEYSAPPRLRGSLNV